MKEEIKLKYMTDFLENVYKDIKKQRRLEEELEKERKFINKIKGDSEDEMKELLEHIEILDNTDYILHSDKAKALLDYIENLQSQLKAKEEAEKEFIKYLEEEINKIKEQINNYNIWHEVGTDINFLILKKQFNMEILSKYKEILSKGENK